MGDIMAIAIIITMWDIIGINQTYPKLTHFTIARSVHYGWRIECLSSNQH